MLLLTLRETYALNRLSRFKNLRRKGGKFDHRPGPSKVLLRHWAEERVIAQTAGDAAYKAGCSNCTKDARIQQLHCYRLRPISSAIYTNVD